MKLNPDDELARLLEAAAGKPVIIEHTGVQYRIAPEDPFAFYDPEKALAAIRARAGVLNGAGVDVEQLLKDIQEERTQNSSGRPAEE